MVSSRRAHSQCCSPSTEVRIEPRLGMRTQSAVLSMRRECVLGVPHASRMAEGACCVGSDCARRYLVVGSCKPVCPFAVRPAPRRHSPCTKHGVAMLTEKYLREVWPAITRALREHGIGCELNLVSARPGVMLPKPLRPLVHAVHSDHLQRGGHLEKLFAAYSAY